MSDGESSPGRAYSFVSRWRIDATPERCWDEVTRMLRPGAPSWWPGVRIIDAAPAITVGSEVTMAVRTPFGYGLRIRATVTEAVEREAVTAASRGDLEGTGRVVLESMGAARTLVTILWEVRTRRAWMNRTAPVLRPLFELAHTIVMRAGERGLRRAVRR